MAESLDRSLDRHEGGLEPGEDYEGRLFAQATFDDATAGSWASSSPTEPWVTDRHRPGRVR
jgi:hypothetical protein